MAVAVPAQAVCVSLGDAMADCHFATTRAAESHQMQHCEDGTSVSAGCCGTSLSERGDDLVLKRRGDEHGVSAAYQANRSTGLPLARVLELVPRGGELLLRPPRYELFSTLLL